MDRLRQVLEASARAATRRWAYTQLVPAQVLQDHGDHHVDLRPLDPDWPDMVRVPYCMPAPGMQTRVRPGSVAVVGFLEADPARPVVIAWLRAELEWCRLASGAAIVELDAATGEVRVNP